MKYLILYYYTDEFEIVDGKEELETKLHGISEDVMGNGMVRVYDMGQMQECGLKLKTKPAWTLE